MPGRQHNRQPKGEKPVGGKDIDALIAELTCDDVIRCQKARRLLVDMGQEAVPALVEALTSKRTWVRWEAAKALSQIADPAATAALVKALNDKEFDVRWLAAEGLVAIGKHAVIPLLRALIDTPESTWIREGAHHVLHDMSKGSWGLLLEPLMAALEDVQASLEVPLIAKKSIDALKNTGFRMRPG